MSWRWNFYRVWAESKFFDDLTRCHQAADRRINDFAKTGRRSTKLELFRGAIESELLMRGRGDYVREDSTVYNTMLQNIKSELTVSSIPEPEQTNKSEPHARQRCNPNKFGSFEVKNFSKVGAMS